MKHIVVATPNIDGKVDLKFAQALSRSVEMGTYNDIRFHLDFVEHGSVPSTLQKNIICNQVLTSDIINGGVLLIDPSISWDPKDLISIVSEEDSVVSGTYPNSSQIREEYGIILKEDLDIMATELLAAKVPLKFLYIPKKVLLGLTQFVEKAELEDGSFYFFFKEEIKNGKLHEEDHVFSELVTSSGFKLIVDSRIECTNTALMPLKTSYRSYMARKWVTESTDMPTN